jgi:high-affinity Fe2+/Pb2+ permease
LKFRFSYDSTLSVQRAKRDDCFGPNEPEKACFGLPYGGVIIGIVIGVFIIILGLAQLAGQNVSAHIGPFILILIGVLVLAGAIYGLSRRRH